MKYLERRVLIAAVLIVLSPLACDFSPTAPFEGFDGQGSRISGVFTSGNGAGASLTAMSQNDYKGIRVYVQQDPTISTFVKSNGSFTLAGLPTGDITLVFEKDGSVIGRLTFEDIVPNQELRVVVTLNDSNHVELVEVIRDSVGLGDCARGAGFWCQNQDGQNPNMSPGEFEIYAAGALDLFEGKVIGIEDKTDIEAAVCDTGNQLLRQLTALALNLAAETVTKEISLMGESYTDVGAAFEAGIAAASGDGSRDEVNDVKDVLDRINNNMNMEGDCEAEEDDDDEEDDDSTVDIPPECEQWVSGHKITICHKDKNTISIDLSAWPAHQAHGDYCGPCK